MLTDKEYAAFKRRAKRENENPPKIKEEPKNYAKNYGVDVNREANPPGRGNEGWVW